MYEFYRSFSHYFYVSHVVIRSLRCGGYDASNSFLHVDHLIDRVDGLFFYGQRDTYAVGEFLAPHKTVTVVEHHSICRDTLRRIYYKLLYSHSIQ